MTETSEKSESDALSSVTFEQLVEDESILAGVQKLGFSTPTDVQARTIPLAIGGRDLIVQAQTGSGKTLAFGIPLLHQMALQDAIEKVDYTFGLIIAPTRELAVQVSEAISEVRSDVTPACLIGGADASTQKKALKEDCRIVVGTPGRLLDMMRQRVLKLERCRYFALDEADEMLSMGFIEDIRAILSCLPDKRQGLFVSATITGRVEMLARSFLTKPEQILIGDFHSDIPDIEHLFCEVGGDIMAKPSALCDLIETMRPRSAIIFCNTKSDTTLVEALMRRRGFDARRINSDLTQAKRDRIMVKIRKQELQFLVATDIAARGLDIEQIDLVINYNIHDQTETYIHRTGRTGRAGRSGKAVSLIGPRDHGAFHFLKKVVDFNFVKLPLPSEDEVADARLSHLYELIRQKEVKISDRELFVAKKLIKELGAIETPTEELATIIAKLCQFSIEHFVNSEADALDEELDAPDEAPDRGKNRKKGRNDRDNSERGDSRSEKRGRDRGDKNKDRNRDERKDRKDKDRERPERSRDKPEQETPDEIRLYIGQGMSQGMTKEVFSNLAAERGEIEEKDLRKLTIRDQYGFVDLYKPQAEKLIEAMGGVEFNGEPLPLEKATTLSNRRRGGRPSGGRRSGGRDRSRDGGRDRGRGSRDKNQGRGRRKNS